MENLCEIGPLPIADPALRRHPKTAWRRGNLDQQIKALHASLAIQTWIPKRPQSPAGRGIPSPVAARDATRPALSVMLREGGAPSTPGRCVKLERLRLL